MKHYFVTLFLLLLASSNGQSWIKVSQQAYLTPGPVTTYNQQLARSGEIDNYSLYDLTPVQITAVTNKKHFENQAYQANECQKGSFIKIKIDDREEIVFWQNVLVIQEEHAAADTRLLILRDYTENSLEMGCWNNLFLAIQEKGEVELILEDGDYGGEDPACVMLEVSDGMEDNILDFYKEDDHYIVHLQRNFQDGGQFYHLKLFSQYEKWYAQKSEPIQVEDNIWEGMYDSFVPIEQEVIRLNQLAYDNFRSNDFVDRVNDYIAQLKTSIQENPEMITYPFTELNKGYGIHIATSVDNNLKFYTWNTETGGSMKYFEGLYQTRKHGIVQTHELEYGEGDPGYYVSKIHTVSNGVDVYYVVIANEIYSNRDIAQTAMAYKINQDNILVPIKLFKTKKRSYDRIPVQYNFFSAMDGHDERPIEVIKYDAFSKIFSFTLVDKNDDVTDKFLQYKWNGDAFEYIGIQ